MKPRSLAVATVIAIIVLAGVALMLMGRAPGPETSTPPIMPVSGTEQSSGGPVPLPAVEVRSYEGKGLSSVNDFHENSILGPQHINITDYRLTITGLTNMTRVWTYGEILDRNPHYAKVVTLHCVEGWDVTILWEGVLVRDLILNAGVDPRANTVIFTAHDGYTTSFPLDYLMNRQIMMAYGMNNITLPDERGYPFELVAEDKWGYKWIKWIEKIELSDDPTYQGYWERRGYSNTGDLDKGYYSL
jgi:DMSO/TMAO reductase YedYZ molybdopterin-dependent catalytic subunit